MITPPSASWRAPCWRRAASPWSARRTTARARLPPRAPCTRTACCSTSTFPTWTASPSPRRWPARSRAPAWSSPRWTRTSRSARCCAAPERWVLSPRRHSPRARRHTSGRSGMTPNVYEEDEAQAMRVVVGEDQALMREGIVRLLEEAGFDVVGQAGDAVDLRRKVGAHKPDVALVDIQMPPTCTDDGLRAAIQIRSEHPRTSVLVLSQYIEESYAVDLIGGCAEGVGYLLKDRVGDLDEFAEAVRRVGEGGSVLDPEVVTRMLARNRAEDPVDELSPREREVLELMAEGRSNQGIADRLWVTESAV